jgi:YD repeat-containing protein
MIKYIIAGFLLTVLLSGQTLAQYQNRTYYGANGRVIGRSTTSSSGQTTYYGTSGAVIGRTAPVSGGTTIIYDANGRRVGSVTRNGR